MLVVDTVCRGVVVVEIAIVGVVGIALVVVDVGVFGIDVLVVSVLVIVADEVTVVVMMVGGRCGGSWERSSSARRGRRGSDSVGR